MIASLGNLGYLDQPGQSCTPNFLVACVLEKADQVMVYTGLLAALLSLPIQSTPTSRFTSFDLPTPLSGPCDLTEGPDGALWGEDILLNTIFRLDPSTGTISQFPIPFTTPLSNQTLPPLLPPLIANRTALSCAIRTGRDGKLYASNGLRNQLVRLDPATGDISIFDPPGSPLGDLQPFNDLYSAADGIWLTQTTGNVVQFFSFDTERFETHVVPTPAALPLGVFVASTGTVYVAELLGNKILVLEPATGEVVEVELPEPLQLPAVVRAEREGWVYFSMVLGNGIGRIRMGTNEVELFHTEELLGLGAEDTIDGDGGVWLSFFDVDALARLDTRTLEFDYVPFPGTLGRTGKEGILGDLPPAIDVAVNYGPGDAVWFTNIFTNQVIRYSLS